MAAEPACLSTAADLVPDLNDFLEEFCPTLPRKLFCTVRTSGEFALRMEISGLSFSKRGFCAIISRIRITTKPRRQGRRWTVDLSEAHEALRTRFVQRHSFGKLLYVKDIEAACPNCASDVETCKLLLVYLMNALMRALDRCTELKYDGL